MNELKFDRNRRRVKECPCGKSNADGKFTPYVGYDTKGYCHSCGLTFLPEISPRNECTPAPMWKPKAPKPIVPIPDGLFNGSMMGYDKNHLIRYFRHRLDNQAARRIITTYLIGTSSHWQGATLLWQIDKARRIRAGKVMLFNPDTGKRVQKPFSHTTWIHSITPIPEYELNQCFFGEHLLTDTTRPVAIAESEKTAMIMSEAMPEIIWLSCGGREGLTEKKCEVLRGREVILYPDAGCLDQWKRRADDLNHITEFKISELIEGMPDGIDLADVISSTPPVAVPPPQPPKPSNESSIIADTIFPYYGNDVLNDTELIHALVWYSRRKLPAIERAKPTTEIERQAASNKAAELIATGAVICTPPPVILYYHYTADPYGYKK
jgi:hypothetical protein